MIADRIVIENNEIIFRLDLETAGANASEIAVRARDEAQGYAEQAETARDEAVDARDEAVNAASQAIGAKDEVEIIGNQVSEDRIAVASDREAAETARNVAEEKSNDILESADVIHENYESLNYLDFINEFDGTGYYDLGSDFIIKDDGDFIEFNVSWPYTSFYDGLGLAGKGTGSGSNVYGIYAQTQVRLRETGSNLPYLTWTGLPSLSGFNVIRLIVSEGTYNLYVNGDHKGSRPVTNGIEIRDIGRGYNHVNLFKGRIKDFSIKSGDKFFSAKRFTGPRAVNVKLTLDVKKDDIGEEYPDFFYEYNPATIGSSRGRFTFYTKRKGSKNRYVGHFISRFYDENEEVYVDYWRHSGASNYIYDGAIMLFDGTESLLSSENEFTMKCTGKSDHTGGWHGDEMTVSAHFIANGIEIPNDAAIPLTDCQSVRYQVVSTLHETAPAGGSPVPGHPIIADHIKSVIFQNGGFVCRNVIRSRVSGLSIDRLYAGLLCNHKNQALRGYTEDYGSIDFVGDNGQKLNSSFSREFNGYNSNTGLSSYVSSKCIYPAELDNQTNLFITDRTNDSKYYRYIGPLNLNNNDRIIVESMIECIGG